MTADQEMANGTKTFAPLAGARGVGVGTAARTGGPAGGRSRATGSVPTTTSSSPQDVATKQSATAKARPRLGLPAQVAPLDSQLLEAHPGASEIAQRARAPRVRLGRRHLPQGRLEQVQDASQVEGYGFAPPVVLLGFLVRAPPREECWPKSACGPVSRRNPPLLREGRRAARNTFGRAFGKVSRSTATPPAVGSPLGYSDHPLRPKPLAMLRNPPLSCECPSYPPATGCNRYWSASERCCGRMRLSPSRSAIVRATRSVRW